LILLHGDIFLFLADFSCRFFLQPTRRHAKVSILDRLQLVSAGLSSLAAVVADLLECSHHRRFSVRAPPRRPSRRPLAYQFITIIRSPSVIFQKKKMLIMSTNYSPLPPLPGAAFTFGTNQYPINHARCPAAINFLYARVNS
jgi:hypothetical protein